MRTVAAAETWHRIIMPMNTAGENEEQEIYAGLVMANTIGDDFQETFSMPASALAIDL